MCGAMRCVVSSISALLSGEEPAAERDVVVPIPPEALLFGEILGKLEHSKS
jgi:hypothetical protein